jgi:hypothetical protein
VFVIRGIYPDLPTFWCEVIKEDGREYYWMTYSLERATRFETKYEAEHMASLLNVRYTVMVAEIQEGG